MLGLGGGESGQLLYIPAWAKALILLVLSVIVVAGTYVSISFVGTPERSDWIIIGMGATQIAGTGLIIAIVVLFSESDANIGRLEARSDQFLRRHVRRALGRITVPGTDAATLRVKNEGSKDIFGGLFLLEGKNGFRFKIWIGINVYRIFVIYFVDVTDRDVEFVNRLREIEPPRGSRRHPGVSYAAIADCSWAA